MPKNSIQRRLIAAVILSQLLLAIGLVGGSVYLNQHLLRRAFDNALRERAMSVAALVRYSEEEAPRLIFEDDLVPPAMERNHPDVFEIVDDSGKQIARSKTWPGDFPASGGKAGGGIFEFFFERVPYRGLRVQTPVFDREPEIHTNPVLTVTYASPIDQLREQVLLAGVYTAVGTGILLLLGIAFAVWAMRRGLRPLSELAGNAASVSPTNWELHPSPSALETMELAPLTNAMTAMLDSLHRAFTQQREFVANAAHELKTPVAILKSTLQSLLQVPRTTEDYRAGISLALQDMERLENLLHLMLRLARAEQSVADDRSREIVDVVATCQSALDRLAPSIRETGIAIQFTHDGDMPIRADADDLSLVWSNLLENALRVSPKGGHVELRLNRSGNQGLVEIEDEGPGIAAADLPRIFDRFYRGDSSRNRKTGGYGLGLAISKALIEAYGGSITVDSANTKGTTMRVLVPLTSSPARETSNN